MADKIITQEKIIETLNLTDIGLEELGEILKKDPLFIGDRVIELLGRPFRRRFGEDYRIIGVAEELHGTPVINFFFDQAVPAYLDRICNPGVYSPLLRKAIWKSHQHALQVVVTEAGRQKLLNILEWDQIRKDIFYPEKFDGVKIGEGSEGDVYRYTIGDKHLIVKLFSAEKQANIDKFSDRSRIAYPKPDFTERVGFTKQVVKQIQTWPRRNFRLSCLEEYAASQDFIITEMGPAVTVEALIICAGLSHKPAHNTQKTDSFRLAKGITYQSIRSLKDELEKLDDFCRLIKFLGIGYIGESSNSSLECDLYAGNLLVRDFDPQENKFELVLIDQGQPATMHSDSYFHELEMLSQSQRSYDRLIKIPRFRYYLEKNNITRPETSE